MNEEDALVVTMEAPIHYSNVSLLDPVTGKPCSTCFMYQEDGTKVRQGLDEGSAPLLCGPCGSGGTAAARQILVVPGCRLGCREEGQEGTTPRPAAAQLLHGGLSAKRSVHSSTC